MMRRINPMRSLLMRSQSEANAVLGDVLTELQRPEEARAAYEKALHLAQTVEPEFQVGAIDGLRQKLTKLRMPVAGSSGIN